MIYMNFHKKV